MSAIRKVECPEVTELGKLGLYLRAARIERGLSQSELAGRSRLSQTQISYFEAGTRLPSLDQFLRIARSLGISIQKLIAGSDRPGNGPARYRDRTAIPWGCGSMGQEYAGTGRRFGGPRS